MEQTPQKAPLPCFGLEHDRNAPECRQCPHADRCIEYMGTREGKVPLDRIRFDILPPNYREHTLASYQLTDPELPYLQRLFCDCYKSVFHRNPTENISRYKDEIARNANKVPCSVRMFLLANMVAHEIGQGVVVGHTEKARASKFKGILLTGALSIRRAQQYQKTCQDRYGTFSLKSLEILANDDKDPIEGTMLRSETTAGIWLVNYKIRYRAPRLEALAALYEDMELHLDPEWLALDDNYAETVLKPYVDRKTGTEVLQRHRFNAFHVHARFKRRPSLGRNAWLARQDILRDAVRAVLDNFGYAPGDFLYTREPVTNMPDFWLELGKVIRHNHCLRFINGEPSYYATRRITVPTK